MELPDGRLLGTAGAYEGNFIYDPKTNKAEHLGKIWEEAGKLRGIYQRQLAVAVLSLLYGTGLRRGELERLNLADWRREENLLRIDGHLVLQDRAAEGEVAGALGQDSPRLRVVEAGRAIERAALAVG